MSTQQLTPLVYKQFCDTVEMARWLADSSELAKLQTAYPPPKFTASVDTFTRQVIVKEIDQ